MSADTSNVNEKLKLSVAPNGDLKQTTQYEVTTPLKLMKVGFIPQKNTVLVDPIPMVDKKTLSGIVLPPDQEPRGIIVAVGKDVTDYVPGDVVLMGNPKCPLYFIDGHMYAVEYESGIIGKYSNYKMTSDGLIRIDEGVSYQGEPTNIILDINNGNSR